MYKIIAVLFAIYYSVKYVFLSGVSFRKFLTLIPLIFSISLAVFGEDQGKKVIGAVLSGILSYLITRNTLESIAVCSLLLLAAAFFGD